MEDQIQPNITPAQPLPEVSVLPPKNWLKILLFILLGLVVIAVSVFVGIQIGRNQIITGQQTTPSTQTVVNPTALPTTNPTADWKTYTNPIHKIKFNYPPTWQVDNKGDQDSLNTQVTLTKDQAKIKMYFNMDGIGGQGQTYQGQPFNLDGNSLFRFVKTNSYDNTQMIGISTSLTNTLGVFEVNGKTYSITLTYSVSDSQTETGSSLEKEFDQILSTFKFLEQNQKSEKEVVLSAAESYLDAIISQNKQGLMSYLTIEAAERYKNTLLPTGFKTHEILNEFHSVQEETDFYKQTSIPFAVKLYQDNDPEGTLFTLTFTKENGLWKTNVWPPQP